MNRRTFRGNLNNAIHAESDKGNPPGPDAGENCDEPFKAVVNDGEVFKPAAPSDEGRAAQSVQLN
jgi:hypothetical protein